MDWTKSILGGQTFFDVQVSIQQSVVDFSDFLNLQKH